MTNALFPNDIPSRKASGFRTIELDMQRTQSLDDEVLAANPDNRHARVVSREIQARAS